MFQSLAHVRMLTDPHIRAGITDKDLTELGIESRLIRNSVLRALADLVKTKGSLETRQ
jgi:hypothetical protein